MAAPIVAHALGTTTLARIAMVGKPAVFASASSAAPATALPAGTVNGSFLVTYVETPPSSSVTCANGWVKRLDQVSRKATRLVACTRVQSAGAPSPRVVVTPATHVSMVTMAFSGVDPAAPVGATRARRGLTGPSVKTTRANSMLVLVEGSPHWRSTINPPPEATKAAATNDRSASQIVTALKYAPDTGNVASGRWSRDGAAGSNSSGVALQSNAAAKAAAAADRQRAAAVAKAGPESLTAALVLNPRVAPVSTTIATTAPSTPSTTSAPVTTTTTGPVPPPPADHAPTEPPVVACGNESLLDGPSTAAPGAVTVPAGNNGAISWQPDTTYWFAPGLHTLGTGMYNQIIPADHDIFVGAPGAIIDGQGKNNFAFTQHATGVMIQHLTIRNFVAPLDQGVVNHDSGNGWTISNNSIVHNTGAALMAGANQVVRYNCIADNGQYGMNAYQAGDGITNLVVDHNEIAGNNTGHWEQVHPGCGCTGGVKLWAVRGAKLTNNFVHDNLGVGLWADTNNVGVEFVGNYISDNDGEGIFYEISYNAYIHNNTLVRNALEYGPRNPGFPTGAIYLSESGGDARLNGGKFATLEISGNVLTDNWSGVILWENADRFCGSPANTSGGYCTLVGHATMATCVAGTINVAPYADDCRWKTQNVSVHDNEFNLDPAKVPGCTLAADCGINGMFSNWGTYPSWSPYKGPLVGTDITFHQGNRFAANHYNGAWHFMSTDQATKNPFSVWRAPPLNQDQGSTLVP